jgi:hypothetical protein
MAQNKGAFQLFNLETMSGVYPGSRTAVMQRIRLLPQTGEEKAPRWARLLWYNDPPSCVLYLQAETPEQWQETPLLRIEDPDPQTFGRLFREGLSAAGWSPFTCGNCRHWQPLLDTPNEDNITLGRCGWGEVTSATVTMPEPLRYQSVLALGCPAWEITDQDRPAIPALPRSEARVYSAQPDFWQGVRVWLGMERPEPKRPSWGERIIERSGVGAGTEPCAACQGRIANLGALIVATNEDDKRTFSVWRCRRCQSFYLNDWIDRWERLDSLETEESYYRLSPVEAVELLALFDGVIGGEHPAGRRNRTEQRAWLEAFIQNRPRLSHQIRQGR